MAARLRLLLALTVLSLGSSCVDRLEPDLIVWHAYRGAEEDALRAVVAEYQTLHPDTIIELVPVPHQALRNKLNSAVPRGNGPDLFIAAQEQVGAWSNAGVIAPLDSDLSTELESQIGESLLNAVRINGHQWGIPIASKTTALFYNPEALSQLGANVPQTMDELIATARRFSDPTENRFGLVYPSGDFYFHSAWLFGLGGAIEADDEPRIDLEENDASMVFVAGLQDDSQILPREAQYSLMSERFSSGNALFVINGPWFLGELGETPFAVAPLPTLPGGQPARPFVTVESVFLTPQPSGDRRALAVDFMHYLAGPE
ncbi:MAG: extracellular solute-binding protein, partial [Myxococcales bacterium]|nr:extracellular solute-binding protein [Myxococcales bacterium]